MVAVSNFMDRMITHTQDFQNAKSSTIFEDFMVQEQAVVV